jgi:hypothetical protein
MNTFLWVALVFKELVTVDGWDAIDAVKKIPPGLSELYDHIMTRIEYEREIDLFLRVCTSTLISETSHWRASISRSEEGRDVGERHKRHSGKEEEEKKEEKRKKIALSYLSTDQLFFKKLAIQIVATFST